ncbi:MAG: iron ABC transporter substrate-binding protein [Microthrixaceae bacterium]
MTRRWTALIAIVMGLALLGAACSDDESGDATTTTGADGAEESEQLVIYSGRDEELVGPLIEKFEAATGIETEVRYGNSAELGAALLEEDDNTPADVFYSQEVGAVGVLSKAGLLTPLPTEVVELVDERFRPAEGTDWVGVTGRSRVMVVNPDLVPDPPSTVLELTDPQYKGQIGWAPSNASFQAFITAFRVSQGEDAASEWLDAMIANEPQTFESNGDILEAVNTGELGIGLINHYYWARMVPEVGGVENMGSQLIFPEGDDPGALVNATAIGITNTGAENPAALEFVEFLLSEEGQTTFVEETWEYPLVEGIADPEGVPPLDELAGPQLDLTDLDSLEESITLLTDKGLLG